MVSYWAGRFWIQKHIWRDKTMGFLNMSILSDSINVLLQHILQICASEQYFEFYSSNTDWISMNDSSFERACKNLPSPL